MTTPELLALLREVRSNYGRLHDFVSDCIEGGRLTEDMLPDDYKAIADQLEACVGTDHRLGLALDSKADPFLHLAYVVGIEEHATILAALRFYYEHGQGEPDNRSDEIHALAADLEEGSWDSLPQQSVALLFQRLAGLTERKVAPLTNPDEPDERSYTMNQPVHPPSGIDDLLTLIFQLELWARGLDKTDGPHVPPALRQQMQAALADDGPFQARIFLREDSRQPVRRPLTEHERDRLLHAAFIMEGVRDLPGYNAMLEKWDQGCTELVDQLMRYVPVIDAAMRTANALNIEYAGVFDYEVSSPFGLWCAQRVAATGVPPPHDECVGYISGAARRFFQKGEASAEQLAAVRSAVEAYATDDGETA